MAFFSVVAGIGNGVFHPVDYTLLNRKVSAPRLGHAYSVHGITGSLGWALAPALVVPLAIAFGWRVALAAAGCVAVAVLVVLLVQPRQAVAAAAARRARPQQPRRPKAASTSCASRGLDVLRVLLLLRVVLSVVQAFAPEAARHLHACRALAAACLTVYMVCSAGGMVLGGFLASTPARCERLWSGAGFGLAPLDGAGDRGFSAAARRSRCRCCLARMGFASGHRGAFARPAGEEVRRRRKLDRPRVRRGLFRPVDHRQAVRSLVFGAPWTHQTLTRGLLLAGPGESCSR
jgi:MFS family permease